MAWKGTIRTLAEAINNRDARLARHVPETKEVRFVDPWDQAQFEARRYNEWIEILTSIHRAPVYEHDWVGIAEEPTPTAPGSGPHGQDLRGSQQEPGFLDKLGRRKESPVRKVAKEHVVRQSDSLRHKDWEATRDWARSV